jgi:catechol 2,3-dioxygenase-like lactoylglutathione lyase family enzyme
MPKNRLHHVGIIVPNEERVTELLDLLGLERGQTRYVPEYQANCVFARGDGPTIEFIVPKGGKLAEFNQGIGGLHHVAIEVDDLEAFSEELRCQDVSLIEETPVDAGSVKINFLPPIFTRGFTVEFVERIKE